MTRAQLIALGLDDTAIGYRVRQGRLYRVHHGVYAVGRPPVVPLERAAAAVLAGGPGAVLSHGSAMTLWGFWRRWDMPFEVTVLTDRRPAGIRTHRTRGLRQADLTRQLGVPVTSPARTLLDIAPRLTDQSLARAVNDALLTHFLRPGDLAEVVDRHPCGRGAVRLARFTSTVTPTRSSFEDSFPAFCTRHGLPEPLMNATVWGYEVDALFVQEKLIVELDSWTYHSSRRSFEGDRERDTETLAHGFGTVRITWERFERRPEQEARRLQAILAERRRQAAA